MNINDYSIWFQNGQFYDRLKSFYGTNQEKLNRQAKRYVNLLERFSDVFPGVRDVDIFSTPGRIEVGGNHTDHNHGKIIAAAVDLDIIAVASAWKNDRIVIYSEGYPEISLSIHETAAVEEEKYTSAALVRGVFSRMKMLGYRVGGFCACMDGIIPKGSGLSSSAAFEVMIAHILNDFYNQSCMGRTEMAQTAQYSENHYFGKPCGLMDQCACAYGGFIYIDFMDTANPLIEKLNFDFSASGHKIIITDTGGNHADMNEDYAMLEDEMKSVARAMGGKVLRDTSLDNMVQRIRGVRGQMNNDRALLRAFHYFYENQGVDCMVNALKSNNLLHFLELIQRSGISSWTLCQNCYSSSHVAEQGISLALALSDYMLQGRGASRVHGGGFAGTIQAFVPDDVVDSYVKELENIFGTGACHQVIVRPAGSISFKSELFIP
jgi:galactokinase